MAPPHLSLLFILPLLIVLQSPSAATQTSPSPQVSLNNCSSKCGDITVPYPYGFEPNCFREEYELVCNKTYKPARLFVRGYEVVSISLGGRLQISVLAKHACYTSGGGLISTTDVMTGNTYIALGDVYLMSVSNSFFAIGCPNLGYFVDANGSFVSGCVSGCRAARFASSGTNNGLCTGVGCCQSSISKGLSHYEPYLSYITSAAADKIGSYSTNCLYVFLADSEWFKFNESYLSMTDGFRVQVGLDWAIRNVANCSAAIRNVTDYACKSANSACYEPDNGAGYLCNCSEGYQGNPYIAGGCQDIDECELKAEYPCYGVCENTIGSYICTPTVSVGTQVSLPDCRSKCGDTTVPYPYGFEPGCFREEYDLVCNETYSPARLFARGYEVVSISTGGQLQISVPAKRFCYNSNGDVISTTDSTSTTYIALGDLYLMSVSNSFFAIGCPNLGYFVDAEGCYVSGCLSGCQGPGFALSGTTNGSCNRVGCCQSSIPKGLSFYEPYLSNIQTTSAAAQEIRSYTTKCSYVFLAESNWFEFNDSYLSRTDDFRVQVGLDWAIRNVANCSAAERNATDYACKSGNSTCYSPENGAGYLCKCLEGYGGNPYITGGCQDINECELKDKCYGDCKNTDGSYTCTCPNGYEGNATREDGCRKKDGFTLAVKIVIGVSGGAFIVAFSGFWLYLAMQKRRLIRAKQHFFEQNGGVLLQQQMKSYRTSTFKIYTEQELEKATEKFSEERVLGRGGHGIVYKGILEDGIVVAIKKSKIMEENETREFAKEMMILSQINHKNVVKLLGCCLEVEVPMLVYEYISNGTLYHYIHKNSGGSIPAIERIRIAAESADALAYMHSSASPPILHGDVKTANILLDDKFMAKVSDFGASKLAPNDEVEIATLVQGTCGYLDPEYLLTCQLTDKSDVYSFAVIILELLTKRKALYFDGPEEDRSLASSFCVAKKEGRFVQILDAQVRDELKLEVIEEIGDLVMHCLNMNREERPTMREVADTLERARRFQKESESGAGEKSLEETESLLGDSVDLYTRDSSMSYSFAQEAIIDMLQGRRRL